LRSTLKSQLPALVTHLQKDGRHDDLKKLWGMSINYDELAKGTIVQPQILDTLRLFFGETGVAPGKLTLSKHPVEHAGMEHTYGYLFSVLPTSFGYKRARWVRPDINHGFGLPEGVIGPAPSRGSLFVNASYLGGMIAFRGEEHELAILKKYQKQIPQELASYDFKKLSITRLEETLLLGEGKTARTVVLRTDLVAFPNQVADPAANNALLVYSVLDSSEGNAKLVTLFPVQKSFVEMVLNPSGLGENRPIITRYNAYVEGVTDETLTGSRKLAK
jgi:hypothetical protein